MFNFYYGAGFDRIIGLREIGNDFHHLAFDGTRHGQIVNGLIANNRFRDMTSTKEGHRDMIQFWTEGDTIPSQNVVIRGNIITIDDAPAKIQGIFWGNSEVMQYGAGAGMFYKNITIEDNLIYTNQPHGIFIQAANGLSIRNNVVLNDLSNHGIEARLAPGDRSRSGLEERDHHRQCRPRDHPHGGRLERDRQHDSEGRNRAGNSGLGRRPPGPDRNRRQRHPERRRRQRPAVPLAAAGTHCGAGTAATVSGVEPMRTS